MLEHHWLVLKYVGGIVAAFYGLYATVTDFKENKNGESRLTWKGWVGIAVLIVSSALSLTADKLKDGVEAKEKAQAQKEHDREVKEQLQSAQDITAKLNAALRSLEHDTATTSAILTQTQRAAHPLREFEVSFSFRLAADDPFSSDVRPLLASELEQHFKQLGPIPPPPFSDREVWWSGNEYPPKTVSFQANTKLLPPEIAERIATMTVDLRFNRQPLTPDAKAGFYGKGSAIPDLATVLLASRSGPLAAALNTISFDMQKRRLIVSYLGVLSDPRSWSSSGRIVNMADLEESQIVIGFIRPGELERFSLRTWDGQDFDMLPLRIKRAPERPLSATYYGRFSDVFKSRRASN